MARIAAAPRWNRSRPAWVVSIALSAVVLAASFPAEVSDSTTTARQPDRSAPLVRVLAGGFPHVVLRDGTAEPAVVADRLPVANGRSAVGSRVIAKALTSADFDGDGIDDVAVGYATPYGGIVGIRRGNVEAFIPYRGGRRIDGVPPAFLEGIALFDLDIAPDFIAAGDYDADGFIDLVAASRTDDQLEILTGDGRGGFGPMLSVTLPGAPTAFSSADVNRRDGIADIAVAVTDASGPALLVFESTRGAANATPDRIALDAPATDLTIANVAPGYPIDIVVGSAAGVTIVEGRDRRTYIAAEVRPPVAAAAVTTTPVGAPVANVAVGRFVGSYARDVATLTSDGDLVVLDGETGGWWNTPYKFPDAARHTGVLQPSRTAALRGDDLLIRDPDNHAIHLLHARHFAEAQPSGDAAETVTLDGMRSLPEPATPALTLSTRSPVAAIDTRRVNGDGLEDLIVLADNDEPFAGDLATVRTAPVAIYTVNDPSSEDDETKGDGLCETASGTCTLRAAVDEINRAEGAHEIRFTVTGIETSLFPDRHASLQRTTFVDGFSYGRVEILGQFGALDFTSGAPAGSVVRGMSISSFTGWDGATVEGSHVGVTHDGSGVRDGTSGLNIFGAGAVIGGRLVELRNVVARMQLGSGALVEGNYVGTDYTGSIGLYQDATGIESQGSGVDNVTIGGVEPGAGNVISGHGDANLRNALHISGGGSIVQGNLLGTDAIGTLAIPNSQDGIQAIGDVLIGGTVPGARNVIANSGQYGIRLGGDGSAPVVQGNYIGTDITGKVAMGNALGGISTGRLAATIGGVGGSNVISGNAGDGISIGNDQDYGADFIHNNYIGTDVSGFEPIPNAEHGIDAISETGVEIGGSPELANVIAYNGRAGVNAVIRGTSIRANRIFANAELGITLQNSAIPARNDNLGDPDDHPADDQNYPVLTSMVDGQLLVELDSRPSETFTIDLYGNGGCDASGHGEGQAFIESFEIATDATGHAAATRSPPVTVSTNVIAATATAADNSTSEFSACATIDVPALHVRVLQDETNPRPIANRSFAYGRIDGPDAGNDGVFEAVGTAVSDDDGIVKIDDAAFNPGERFFVRAEHHTKPAVKAGHDAVDNTLYTVFVDNLKLNAAGTLLEAPTLAPNIDDTTDTFVERTSVGFNLVVSVEWDPQELYATGLIDAFREASNLVLDVTDGHAYLDRVAFYANGERWADADVRFYARNTEWPRATRGGTDETRGSVSFPPVHFGRLDENVRRNSVDDPPDPDNYLNYSTLVHELGHYIFDLRDEYNDGAGHDLIDGTNWSIMDSQYLRADPRSSELAWSATAGYMMTRQWALGDKTGWQAFSDRYSRQDGIFDAYIPIPMADRAGPNENIDSPDFNAGAAFEVVDEMERRATMAPAMQVLAEGVPAADAHVVIIKTSGREIRQGKTLRSVVPELSGAIRLRGAEAGDRVLVSRSDNPFAWFSADGVVPPAKRAAAGNVATPDFTIELQPLTGEISMLPSLAYEASDAVSLNVEAAGLPSALSAVFRDASGDEFAAGVSQNGDIHTIELTNATASRSPFGVELSGEDEAAAGFIVPGSLEAIVVAGADTVDAQLAAETMQLELELEDAGDLERIAVFGHDFPVPRTGLPDSLSRVTPVFALGGYPGSAPLAGELTLYWDAGELLATVEDAVNLYRWDAGWQMLETRTGRDTTNQTVLADIPGAGTYAAFIDLHFTRRVGLDDEDGDDRDGLPDGRGASLDYYPGPFDASTTVEMTLASESEVLLEVYDVLGRRVATLLDGRVAAGVTRVRLDGTRLTAGVYFARLRAGGHEAVLAMVKAR